MAVGEILLPAPPNFLLIIVPAPDRDMISSEFADTQLLVGSCDDGSEWGQGECG